MHPKNDRMSLTLTQIRASQYSVTEADEETDGC